MSNTPSNEHRLPGTISHRVPVGDLHLNVVEWRPDSPATPADTLVLLHGLRESAWTFRHLAAALRTTRRVIAIDQRGRGASDWDPARRYDTGTYADDLLAVVDWLRLPVFDLLGHSMGGANAILFAARHPDRVRRLIVEDTGPGASENSPTAARLRAQLADTPLQFASRDAALACLRGLRPGRPDADLDERLEAMLRACADGRYAWRHDQAGIAAVRLAPDPARAVALRPLIGALRCPTLLVRGGESDYLLPQTVDDMLALNPRIVCAEIAGAGHYVHDDAPAAFLAAVARFLEDPIPEET